MYAVQAHFWKIMVIHSTRALDIGATWFKTNSAIGSPNMLMRKRNHIFHICTRNRCVMLAQPQ